MNKEEIRELAGNHWQYTEGLVKVLNLDEETTLGLRYVYIQAFIHGFGHGQEEKGDK